MTIHINPDNTHLHSDDKHPLSKNQINLRAAISQTWQLCKSGREYLGSLSAQSALIYGGFLLLIQAIFGDLSFSSFLETIDKANPEELMRYNAFTIGFSILRSVLDLIFPLLLESVMIVYMCRRFVDNDHQIGEITDLNVSQRELKVALVSLVNALLWFVCMAVGIYFATSVKESGNNYNVADIVKLSVLFIVTIGAFYCNLRIMVAPLLAALPIKKSFKESWSLTKNRVWFFVLFVCLLVIPSTLIKLLLSMLVQKIPLFQTSGIAFGFFLSGEILGLLTKVIPLYMGFIIVYKNLGNNAPSVAQQENAL